MIKSIAFRPCCNLICSNPGLQEYTLSVMIYVPMGHLVVNQNPTPVVIHDKTIIFFEFNADHRILQGSWLPYTYTISKGIDNYEVEVRTRATEVDYKRTLWFDQAEIPTSSGFRPHIYVSRPEPNARYNLLTVINNASRSYVIRRVIDLGVYLSDQKRSFLVELESATGTHPLEDHQLIRKIAKSNDEENLELLVSIDGNIKGKGIVKYDDADDQPIG